MYRAPAWGRTVGEIAFEPRHIGIIEGKVAPENAPMPGLAEIVQAAGDAWTFTHGERIIACWGLLPIWPGRSTIWGVGVRDASPAEILGLLRHVRAKLSGRTEYRVEAHALGTPEGGWDSAHRLVRALGFRFEVYLPSYQRKGIGMSQYVIVKD